MYVSIAKGTDTREMYSRLMAQEIALAEWLEQRERENANQQLSVATEGNGATRTDGEKSLLHRKVRKPPAGSPSSPPPLSGIQQEAIIGFASSDELL